MSKMVHKKGSFCPCCAEEACKLADKVRREAIEEVLKRTELTFNVEHACECDEWCDCWDKFKAFFDSARSAKEHIHTWNSYSEDNRLCCSTCGTLQTEYLYLSTKKKGGEND